MKGSDSQRLLQKGRLLPRLSNALSTERGRLLRDSLLLFVGGFFMSGARIAGCPLPLAGCMASALHIGLRSVSSCAGAVLGYLLLWGGAQGAEMTAFSILMLAAVVVFQGTQLPASRWFLPVMAAGVSATLGMVMLFSHPCWTEAARWAMKLLLAAVGQAAFRESLRGDRRGKVFFLAVLLSGLSGTGLPVDLGLFCAAALTTVSPELALTAAAGVALDLTGAYGNCITVALLLPSVLVRIFRLRNTILRGVLFAGLSATVLLFFGTVSSAAYIGLGLGVVAGTVADRLHLLPSGIAASHREAAARSLLEAAEVLETLRRQLPPELETVTQSEADSVYDGAADRVCRCCARFRRCWEYSASQTCQALNSAAKRIMTRGVATAEDFPESFRESCCHFDGFITALNQELEGMLFRRRYRIELQESRQIVAEEFSCVAEYLRDMQAELQAPERPKPIYQPVIGISTAGKDGNAVNGDRGTCFAGVRSDYYVVLCDGMGTGMEAAALSNDTIRLIRRLLNGGISAESALRIVNGTYLLRGTGCFATVDLLRIDLEHAEAELYKWGSAPSYLREGEKVRKIGTAALPPGVGVGGDHSPERYRLSLRRGEMLVLVSDGASEEETESAIAAFSGDSPRELAALLIAGISAEDDMTAVAISLRPRISCP